MKPLEELLIDNVPTFCRDCPKGYVNLGQTCYRWTPQNTSCEAFLLEPFHLQVHGRKRLHWEIGAGMSEGSRRRPLCSKHSQRSQTCGGPSPNSYKSNDYISKSILHGKLCTTWTFCFSAMRNVLYQLELILMVWPDSQTLLMVLLCLTGCSGTQLRRKVRSVSTHRSFGRKRHVGSHRTQSIGPWTQ